MNKRPVIVILPDGRPSTNEAILRMRMALDATGICIADSRDTFYQMVSAATDLKEASKKVSEKLKALSIEIEEDPSHVQQRRNRKRERQFWGKGKSGRGKGTIYQ